LTEAGADRFVDNALELIPVIEEMMDRN